MALENGVTTFLFPRELLDLAESWRRLGKMSCMFSDGDILLDSRMEVRCQKAYSCILLGAGAVGERGMVWGETGKHSMYM